MTKELQEKLFEKYPKIFRQKDLDMKQTAMCWGIDCRDGWYWLLDNLCNSLQFNTDMNSHTGIYPQVEAVQVKEKFGSLNFYVHEASSEQRAVISFAERLSGAICEKCGATAQVETSGERWVQTLCKNCRD